MDFTSFSPALVVTLVVSLALAPFIAVMVTSFTKIVVVLSLLRNALGLQQVPPNVVINGLAIILSIYVMNPVLQDSFERIQAQQQQHDGRALTLDDLLSMVETGKEPLRAFLAKHSGGSERAFFLEAARRMLPAEKRQSVQAGDFLVVVPAFTVSELTEAFQIGFLLFLPFLVIDLLVSNILLALGMMMLSPTTVSLPFKLLLFVLLSGWAKLIHGLVLTY